MYKHEVLLPDTDLGETILLGNLSIEDYFSDPGPVFISSSCLSRRY